MRKVFKYMKFREDFFDCPKLSLTRPAFFNDPFENFLSNDYLESIVGGVGSTVFGFEKEVFDAGSYRLDINECFRENGVVSLSRDRQSILMWSHYADNHKGIVVEFDLDKIIGGFLADVEVGCNGFDIEVIDVDYDDSYGGAAGLTSVKDIVRHKLQRKATCWEYEEETRIIANLDYANCAVFPRGVDSFWKVISGNSRLQRQINAGEIRYNLSNDKLQLSRGEHGGTSAWTQELVRIQDINFFLDIDPLAINSVYFGCVFPENSMELLKDKVVNNADWEHVRFYRGKRSREKFQLDFYKESF